MGHDIAIRRVEGKGMGIFALRAFVRNEKILIERAAVTSTQLDAVGGDEAALDLATGMQRAVSALMPHTTTSMKSKFPWNSFQMENPPGEEGLFVLMAYANHSCVPNVVHQCVPTYSNLKVLVASRDIKAGEEICHDYVGIAYQGTQTHVNRYIKEIWGFECTCTACTDTVIGTKLTQMRRLDAGIVACGATDVRLPVAWSLAIAPEHEVLRDENHTMCYASPARNACDMGQPT